MIECDTKSLKTSEWLTSDVCRTNFALVHDIKSRGGDGIGNVIQAIPKYLVKAIDMNAIVTQDGEASSSRSKSWQLGWPY
jgi:hypothetical protein